jgi:inorganic pyrophosphatase
VSTPAPVEYSLWHDVDLHVKNWLDEDTGLFRYVNEMPMGTCQKFEVQPNAPQNAIVEDLKSSQRLQAFGQPVPFNYGCFPQTYRDPDKLDDLYDAPGDDDPLDVIDLSEWPSEPGAIVQCRAVGAVCLIDEGEADWKVLVVNTQDPGPLADARSVQDVERIMPGRLAQGLKWMDDFKNSTGKNEAELQGVLGADWAHKLIAADHASWKTLVADTNLDGTSHGHWICAPPQREKLTKVPVVSVGRVHPSAVPGHLVEEPASPSGASRSSRVSVSSLSP